MAPAVYESSPPLRSRMALTLMVYRSWLMRLGAHLNATSLRVPYVLVHLQLQSDGQPVRQDPCGKLLRFEHPVHRREEDRAGSRDKAVPCDHLARILVILAILDHELQFV